MCPKQPICRRDQLAAELIEALDAQGVQLGIVDGMGWLVVHPAANLPEPLRNSLRALHRETIAALRQ